MTVGVLRQRPISSSGCVLADDDDGDDDNNDTVEEEHNNLFNRSTDFCSQPELPDEKSTEQMRHTWNWCYEVWSIMCATNHHINYIHSYGNYPQPIAFTGTYFQTASRCYLINSVVQFEDLHPLKHYINNYKIFTNCKQSPRIISKYKEIFSAKGLFVLILRLERFRKEY